MVLFCVLIDDKGSDEDLVNAMYLDNQKITVWVNSKDYVLLLPENLWDWPGTAGTSSS